MFAGAVKVTKNNIDTFSDGYKTLSEQQKCLFRHALCIFEEKVQNIRSAKKPLKPDARKVSMPKVCAKAAEELNKNKINHSAMSKKNCPTLYSFISKLNEVLLSEHNLSTAYKSSKSKKLNMRELENMVDNYKERDEDFGRLFLKEIIDLSILDGESELRNKITNLTKKNSRLERLNASLENRTNDIVTQLADAEEMQEKLKMYRSENNKLREQFMDKDTQISELAFIIFQLRNVLEMNGIDSSHIE